MSPSVVLIAGPSARRSNPTAVAAAEGVAVVVGAAVAEAVVAAEAATVVSAAASGLRRRARPAVAPRKFPSSQLKAARFIAATASSNADGKPIEKRASRELQFARTLEY